MNMLDRMAQMVNDMKHETPEQRKAREQKLASELSRARTTIQHSGRLIEAQEDSEAEDIEQLELDMNETDETDTMRPWHA